MLRFGSVFFVVAFVSFLFVARCNLMCVRMYSSQPGFLSVIALAKSPKEGVATAYRWTLHGVRGRKLPTVLVSGRRFVSEEGFNHKRSTTCYTYALGCYGLDI